jgi:hypothetical protein
MVPTGTRLGQSDFLDGFSVPDGQMLVDHSSQALYHSQYSPLILPTNSPLLVCSGHSYHMLYTRTLLSFAAVSFGVCTANNQLRLTVSAGKTVFETPDQVKMLENLVREEFIYLLESGPDETRSPRRCHT